jgi:hypothetical protein
MKIFRLFSLVVLTAVTMIAGCGKTEVVTPEVAQMQNQVAQAQRGDLILTNKGGIYLVTGTSPNKDYVMALRSPESGHYSFNGKELVDMGAMIMRQDDEHYSAFLHQFVQIEYR